MVVALVVVVVVVVVLTGQGTIMVGIGVISNGASIRAATCKPQWLQRKTHTLWLFNIAMGNRPFIDGLPIKNCDFP